MTRVGFIGLGSQGAGMARRLIDCGLPTTLWARRAESLEPFAGRAEIATDLPALGAACDVVGVCVTDGAAVRAVTLGDRGVLGGMAAGSILVVHSTIAPHECAEIAAAAAERAVAVVDAPVSGGGAMAAVGQLTVYVGGEPEAVARVEPVLRCYGDDVFHLGPPGTGLRTKLVNNALVASHFALAHDAMAVGERLGIDRAQLGAALRAGSGRSYALDVFCGLGSLDVVAETAGPIMAKDVELFRAETDAGAERDGVLGPAARFVELVGEAAVPGAADAGGHP